MTLIAYLSTMSPRLTAPILEFRTALTVAGEGHDTPSAAPFEDRPAAARSTRSGVWVCVPEAGDPEADPDPDPAPASSAGDAGRAQLYRFTPESADGAAAALAASASSSSSLLKEGFAQL